MRIDGCSVRMWRVRVIYADTYTLYTANLRGAYLGTQQLDITQQHTSCSILHITYIVSLLDATWHTARIKQAYSYVERLSLILSRMRENGLRADSSIT